MRMETVENELTVLEFEDFPLKYDLPHRLWTYEIPASDKASSFDGTHVYITPVTSNGFGSMTCSGENVFLYVVRRLRNYDFDWNSTTTIPLQKGEIYAYFSHCL